MALPLFDDDDTLAAALALIDEWELELNGTSEGSSSPVTTDDSDATRDSPSPQRSPAPSTTSATTTNVRRRQRSSEENTAPSQLSRREELIFLRRKVRELETQLVALQGQAVKLEDNKNDAYSRQLDATWVWQQIASRQLEHRRESERVNLKLRVQVEEQINIAKDLLRVLLRAYQRGDENTSSEDERQNVKRVKLPTNRVEMTEEDQLSLIDELYVERDVIFRSPPYAHGPPVMREIRLKEHTNGEATINVDSSWVLPFAVNHVANAFWMYLVRKHEPNKWRFEPLEASKDTRDILTANFETSGASRGQSATFLGRFVARRVRSIDDQEPAFIMWHKWSNAIQFSCMSMDGVCVHNQSIMRIVWADQVTGSGSVPSEGRLCVVQMSQRIQIKYAANETPTRRRRMEAITNFFMYTVESELHWKQCVLENLLLQSVMPTAPPDAPSWTYRTVTLHPHSNEAKE